MPRLAELNGEIRLRCGCGITYATVEGGYLWIDSRHHGRTHRNGLPLALLARIADGTATLEMLQPVTLERPPAQQETDYEAIQEPIF